MSEFNSKDLETMYSREVSLSDMANITGEIADLKAGTSHWLDRVDAVVRATGFTFSRAKTFIYREARTVEAHEKQIARAALQEIKTRKIFNEQHSKLISTIAHLRETDQDFHSPAISSLERTLSEMGPQNGSLDESGK